MWNKREKNIITDSKVDSQDKSQNLHSKIITIKTFQFKKNKNTIYQIYQIEECLVEVNCQVLV